MEPECRWRFAKADGRVDGDGEPCPDAWETSCGQWCAVSISTPDGRGFRNGFEFCPYCGGSLVLLSWKRKEAAA